MSVDAIRRIYEEAATLGPFVVSKENVTHGKDSGIKHHYDHNEVLCAACAEYRRNVRRKQLTYDRRRRGSQRLSQVVEDDQCTPG